MKVNSNQYKQTLGEVMQHMYLDIVHTGIYECNPTLSLGHNICYTILLLVATATSIQQFTRCTGDKKILSFLPLADGSQM